jgi:spore photoproduct lyase
MPEMVIYADTSHLIAEIANQVSAATQNEVLLINAGEDADSLALEPLTGQVGELIRFFGHQSGAVLELRTKSSHVDTILGLPHNMRTIVAFSLNCEDVVSSIEHRTSELRDRIKAARLCQKDGYRVAIKFEPLMWRPGWRAAYQSLIDEVFASIDGKTLDHVALGTFRFRNRLRETIKAIYPHTELFSTSFEEVAVDQHTYPVSVRKDMYRTVLGYIQTYVPGIPYYLSLENQTVRGEFPDAGYSPH